MAIGNDDSIEMLGPPNVEFSHGIIAPKRQFPAISIPRDVFHCGVQDQEPVRAVRSEVFLYVLLGHPVWCEWSIGKPLIRQRHDDFRNIGATTFSVHASTMDILLVSTHVRPSYIGVLSNLVCSEGAKATGRF